MNALRSFLEQQVTRVEAEKIDLVKGDCFRLGFHLMPPVGWLNDPNGLCQYKGNYHVFFQYAPFEAEGGLKFWGHYESRDLLHWIYTGAVLSPDDPKDCHGVYSGSALVEENEIWLYYTGNVKYSGDYNYFTNGRGSNTMCVVTKDGKNLSYKQCVMGNKDYPPDITCNIRDPKVWKEEKYYMVLGAMDDNEKGLVLLYESEDKIKWKLKNRIQSSEKFGFMWECPDIFKIEEMNFLSISPQGVEQKGICYQNKYQSGYFLINGDYKNDYTLGEFVEWDKGFDFYAPQTFEDEKGRRILIGWMGMADCEDEYSNPTIQHGWQHGLTMPREITRRGEKLLQNPVEEMKQLRKNSWGISGKSILPTRSQYEVFLENEKESNTQCQVRIGKDLYLKYFGDKKEIELLFLGNEGAGRKERRASLEHLYQLDIWVDSSAVEVFCNGGEVVFATRFYPQDGKSTIEIQWEGYKGVFWELDSMKVQIEGK